MRERSIATLALVLAAFPASVAPLGAQEIRARSGSSVVLGGRVQVQYEAPGTEGQPGTFFVRRAWVTMDGSLSDRVGGRVQFDAQGSAVLEAYLELKPSDAFQVQIGQFKRGMSYFWLVANSDLPVIERNARVTGVDHCPGVGGVCSYGQFTGALGLDNYEPGILMTGRFAGQRLGYRITVTNGEGLGRKDVNTSKSVSGRVSAYFMENTRLSAYLALDETLDSRGETMGVPAYGGELEVGTWRQGPHLLVNGLRGRNWKLNDDAGFSAFQVMAFWYRELPAETGLSGIEPLLRVSWADSGMEDPAKVTGTVITPGFMVYAAGRNGISANLDIYRSGDRRDWSLKFQAFTFF